ncbi:CFEM domain-containing protein [Colletotrichum higginsianum]|nr:CFEM domain-containing protein [Colletotrichum higginsianum]
MKYSAVIVSVIGLTAAQTLDISQSSVAASASSAVSSAVASASSAVSSASLFCLICFICFICLFQQSLVCLICLFQQSLFCLICRLQQSIFHRTGGVTPVTINGAATHGPAGILAAIALGVLAYL